MDKHFKNSITSVRNGYLHSFIEPSLLVFHIVLRREWELMFREGGIDAIRALKYE